MSKETMYSADNAWQAELVKVYGKQAGNARYDARGEGQAIEAIEAPLTLATLDAAQRKCLGFDLPPEQNRFINTHEVQ